MGLYKPLILKKLPFSRDKLMQILNAYFRTWSAQKNAVYEAPENVNFRVFWGSELERRWKQCFFCTLRKRAMPPKLLGQGNEVVYYVHIIHRLHRIEA